MRLKKNVIQSRVVPSAMPLANKLKIGADVSTASSTLPFHFFSSFTRSRIERMAARSPFRERNRMDSGTQPTTNGSKRSGITPPA